jgi:hypothetical protein
MIKLIIVLFLLHGCATYAGDNNLPPSGEELFDALLKNGGIKLSSQPLCNEKSVSRDLQDVTLAQHLATILSLSYDTKNTVSLKSSCSKSKYQASAEIIEHVWDCKLEMMEVNADGTFVSSAMLAVNLSLEKKEMISGSLRCF